MTFNALHKTAASSEPVILYELKIGSTTWYHTGAEVDIVAGNNYETSRISHSDISNSGEAARNEVTVTLPTDHPLAEYLVAYIPAHEIYITIYVLEREQSPYELVHEWSGIYTSGKIAFPKFEAKFEPVDYEINREAMAPSFGANCQWAQFDANCGLTYATFQILGAVTAVNGLVVTTNAAITAVATDHFTGGFIEIVGDYGVERAFILLQNSFDLTLDRTLPGMANSISITCVPSCRNDFTRCKSAAPLFDNKNKFQGAPHAQFVNPFEGRAGVTGDA